MLAFVVAVFGVSWGQAPATTTISDVVYRADGNLAGGNAADFLADIQHGQRAVGRGRTKERGPCLPVGFDGGPGSEHRLDAGRNLLHSGVPA